MAVLALLRQQRRHRAQCVRKLSNGLRLVAAQDRCRGIRQYAQRGLCSDAQAPDEPDADRLA
ncbi:hypothetical protein AB2H60_24915 (plasmid) [Escherichia coli]